MARPGARTPEERDALFWAKVVKTDGCWLWTGAKAGGRPGRPDLKYGRFALGRDASGRVLLIQAHVYAWERANGRKMRPGMQGMHTCDTPLCVRPDHVVEGTHDNNMDDMKAKGRAGVNGLRGSHVGTSILTEEQVADIRARYQPRVVTLPMLAQEFGVSSSTIQNIVYRKGWRHV